MWKDLLDEQDEIFYPQSRSPIQSISGSDKAATVHEYGEPRPTLAWLSSLAEKLEEIVVRPGFGLPHNGRTPSPAHDAPEQLTNMFRSAQIRIASPSEQPIPQPSAMAANYASYDGTIRSTTYEQSYEEYGDIYRQIDGDKFVVEADFAANLDLDHAGYDKVNRADPPVAASERQIVGRLEESSNFQEARRELGVRRRAGGNAQTRDFCENEMQRKICTTHGVSAGEKGKESHAEIVSALTGVEKATIFGRTPTPGTVAVAAEAAERTTPPSALFCIFEGKPKKKWRKEQEIEDSRSKTEASKDDYAFNLAVSVAEYVLTTEETHTIEEWRPRLETAKRTAVTAQNHGAVAGDELRSHRSGIMNPFAGKDDVPRPEEHIFRTPAAAEQRASETPRIIEDHAAGCRLLTYTKENQLQIVYKMLCNGMQELCRRFSSFDILATEIQELGGGREELNQMLELLKRTNNRMKDIAYFADEHQLSDVNTFKETMQDMVDAMRERQNSLRKFGVKLWNVSQYSEEYWRVLNGEAARASEETKKSKREGCVVHCWWHSPSECMNDDDVFQD